MALIMGEYVLFLYKILKTVFKDFFLYFCCFPHALFSQLIGQMNLLIDYRD